MTIGTVTGQSISPNPPGTADVRLLQVKLSNESDIQTVQWYPLSGDDSPPMINDLVAVLEIGSPFKIAVGVQDSVVPSMLAGEKKLYSRDGSGDTAAFIALLNNSDVTIDSPYVKITGHASVGTAASGTFASGDGQVIVVQDGIVIGIQ